MRHDVKIMYASQKTAVGSGSLHALPSGMGKSGSVVRGNLPTEYLGLFSTEKYQEINPSTARAASFINAITHRASTRPTFLLERSVKTLTIQSGREDGVSAGAKGSGTGALFSRSLM